MPTHLCEGLESHCFLQPLLRMSFGYHSTIYTWLIWNIKSFYNIIKYWKLIRCQFISCNLCIINTFFNKVFYVLKIKNNIVSLKPFIYYSLGLFYQGVVKHPIIHLMNFINTHFIKFKLLNITLSSTKFFSEMCCFTKTK